jgi:choline dehydrogenase-like flavoprotein
VIHFFALSAYDLLVIGSGFGGTMAAAPAVFAGRRVLMIEAGGWVARGPDNWGPAGFADATPSYNRDYPIDVRSGGRTSPLGTYLNVGGASVFYGGVAMRMREADFHPDPQIDQQSGARWPYGYADLEPFYTEAERLLEVAGDTGADPTDPPRSAPFPQAPGPLAPISTRLADAARALDLHPFRLPLAINYMPGAGRTPCPACGTCDGYACAVQAKNDLATVLLPRLQRAGLELAINTAAVRINVNDDGRRVTGVTAMRRPSGDIVTFEARAVVVAAGAIATPRLLLASGLEALNPAGDAIGRYLMRHCNAVVLGVFPFRPAPDREFHKQLAIHDFYFGHPSITAPAGRLGCLQQFATPAPWVTRGRLPLGLGSLIGPALAFTTGLIVIAEDRPQAANRVVLAEAPALGIPRVVVSHHYDARDLAARSALVGVARRILRQAGALFSVKYPVDTFSHAVGTVRMGVDPHSSPLDAWGAFRGLGNLFVTDGSALPRSGGVNPSLTIAANALRSGTHVLETI